MNLRRQLAILAAATVLGACNGQRPATPAASPADGGFAQFLRGVKEYDMIHDRAGKGLPRPRPTLRPDETQDRRRALAEAIRAARPGARQGDVFGGSQPHIKQVIRTELQGAAGESARRAIMKENPEREQRVEVRVNGSYAESAPLSTMTPALLGRLPVLPAYLQYRFVGDTLILLDTSANLIVDYIPGAIS